MKCEVCETVRNIEVDILVGCGIEVNNIIIIIIIIIIIYLFIY